MKKTLITLALLSLPVFAFAEANPDNNGQATEAQIFTTCSQTAIENRDSSIGSARTAYNNAMAVALGARKDAEKKAVAIEDADEKKTAIKEAVEDYKKAVSQAQDALVKARKEAWAQFETSTSQCREASKEKKDITSELKSDARTMQATAKVEEKKSESLKDTILNSIKNLFKKAE